MHVGKLFYTKTLTKLSYSRTLSPLHISMKFCFGFDFIDLNMIQQLY